MTRRSILGVLLCTGAGIQAAPIGRSARRQTLKVALINYSQTQIGTALIAAIQEQLDNHFLPVWGYTAELYTASSPADVGANDYVCSIYDETDYPGNLGYHGVDDTGRPFAKVFPGTAARNGREFSAILSHEIMEMIANPWGNRVVLYNIGNGSGALYACEVCDPVQKNTYTINDIVVSNFVTPQYFMQTGTHPYDYSAILQAPFTTAPYGSQMMTLVGQVGTRT